MLPPYFSGFRQPATKEAGPTRECERTSDVHSVSRSIADLQKPGSTSAQTQTHALLLLCLESSLHVQKDPLQIQGTVTLLIDLIILCVLQLHLSDLFEMTGL